MRDKAAKSDRAHRVAVVVYDGAAIFELGVACDVFGEYHLAEFPAPWYELSVCGPADPEGSVRSDAGLRIVVPYGLGALDDADTVIVIPAEPTDPVPPEVLAALRAAAARGCRMVSLCTGAFALAAAGILDGLTVTTHWAECAELARRYPRVRVDPGVLYVDEGQVLTSAGSAASIDLCLYLVRLDHGAEVATRLARDLVIPPHRDGGQAQFIEAPVPAFDGSSLFSGTLDWLRVNLDQQVSVAELAARSAMSPRTFARRFVAMTGTTPYQWLLRERLGLAQRLLETSDLPVDAVAARSGFGESSGLRKHFGRVLRTSPQAYRSAFRSDG